MPTKIGEGAAAEGIVIYHVQGNLYFKKTILKDDEPKSMQPKAAGSESRIEG